MTTGSTLTLTYREALQKDEKVFLMGEDVGCYRGAFAVSKGLLQEMSRLRQD